MEIEIIEARYQRQSRRQCRELEGGSLRGVGAGNVGEIVFPRAGMEIIARNVAPTERRRTR